MTISDVSKYWDMRPCNVRHSQIDVDENPLGYSWTVTQRKFFVEPHIKELMGYVYQADHIYDMGCGIGTQAIEYAKMGGRVTAVDVSPKSIAIAKKRLAAEAPLVKGSVKFLVGDIEEYEPPLEQDKVFAFGSIHHTPYPDRAICRAFQCLRPRGEFMMMVYNRFSWKALWIIMGYGRGKFWKWQELIPKHSEAQTGCPITHTYTKRELRWLLEGNGFVVDRIWVDHIFPYRIQDYIQHRYVKEWYWDMMSPRLFRWLERKLGWHMMALAHKPGPPAHMSSGTWADSSALVVA